MIINNNLRNEVYLNNLRHGFWDNRRNLDQLCNNIMGEVDEVTDELYKFSNPGYVYLNQDNPDKPEGAPTELADIIIFVLDYFGDCYIPPEAIDMERPSILPTPIDVEPRFLEFPHVEKEDYLNKKARMYAIGSEGSPKYASSYEKAMKMLTPSFVFSMFFKKEITDAISFARIYALFDNIGPVADIASRDEEQTVSYQLHRVIRTVLMFCQLYGIDIDNELRRKIDYNNSRPFGYRRIGDGEPLVTDENSVVIELLQYPGAYKEVASVIEQRDKENAKMFFRRKLRAKLAQNEIINARKRGR